MKKALIIVESPAKVKTLKKLLGTQYTYASSVGHIRDLPEKGFGIDVGENFSPQYTLLPDKKDVIANLKKAAKDVDIVYLSPDPDREGEAIAWHIAHILPKGPTVKRVTFNAITKEAVQQALQHPREIDLALVNAQQARRLLDRIVGYKISPLLHRRIQSSLSAGRVQSIALKLVVDREKEIEAFIPIEYWNLGGIFLAPSDRERPFRANLFAVDEKKVEKEPVKGKEVTLINNKEAADALVKRIAETPYHIDRLEKKEKKRNPVPPFITSTLQQEASRHFGFSAARTMGIAQSLYEGIDLGKEGAEGLITYMRTDSVRIEPQVIQEARKLIAERYGKEVLPEKPNTYSTKKSAQDAHEAIRPANLHHTPEMVQSFLAKEQNQLYQLIWKRFFASQMKPAIYETITADIINGRGIHLRATGSILIFKGFLVMYEEKQDEDDTRDGDKILPPMEQGQQVDLEKPFAEQAFTRPPPRYSEASLVKELEKSGVGRPSTYAAIMNKIQRREYTIKEKGRLLPTELGRVVTQMLEANFPQIMNIDFTAHMEDDLEQIASNQRDWQDLLRQFWDEFIPTVETAEKEAFVPKIMTDKTCPKCDAPLQKIWARGRFFYGCSRYPDCDYSAAAQEIHFDKAEYAENFSWDQPCPVCQSPMKVRHGRFGAFLGCTRYPECRGIVNIPKKGEESIAPEDLPACPAIDCPGRLVARKSRFGKTFYSCSTYPECDVIVNQLDEIEKKYAHHPRTPYQKKTKGRKTTKKGASKKKGATKKSSGRTGPLYTLTPALATIVGAEKLTRGEVTKKIWEYIKKHERQDPNDKRKILPDAALAQVFGSDQPIDMFAMTKLLSQHMER